MTCSSTKRLLSFLVVTCLSTPSLGWVPINPLPSGRRIAPSSSTRLVAQPSEEDTLRQEIAERNTRIANEEKYAVADGEFLEKLDDETVVEATTVTATSTSIPTSPAVDAALTTTSTGTTSTMTKRQPKTLKSTMSRLTKPRAYPLFLAEKAAELLETTVEDVSKTFGVSTSSSMSTATNGEAVKERVVILGTGWGAASFLKGIDTSKYDVTVISPRNYFLFTPMLAGASTGTVEYRSICEPIREINRKAKYLEATATEIDVKNNIVTCQSVVCDGSSCEIEEFPIDYDRLIVTIGAQTNTFGIPGVREHCCFLKQVEDARRIRTAIVNCFERANLPSLTDEEREQNLTFAVIGAGPTGIEFAAELRDFVEEDGPKYYPHLLKHVRIKVIEASSTVLAPFDKSLQEEAIAQLNRRVEIADPEVRDLLPERFRLTELLLDSSVKEVGEKIISLNDGTDIPYGLSVWAAGNGPIPLTLQLIDALGEEQAEQQAIARGRVAIDPWMRAIGGEGRILAFGDCSCETSNQLPATAQVASQQGEYLASLMNKQYDLSPARVEEVQEDGTTSLVFPPPVKDPEHTTTSLSDAIAGFATNNNEYAKPFQFLNLGILAYTGGGSALAQVTPAPNAPPVKGTGKIGNALWRSVYLSKQVSWRNRLLVVNDWTKRQIFGRDITRV